MPMRIRWILCRALAGSRCRHQDSSYTDIFVYFRVEDMRKVTLIFVRHGETADNARQVIQVRCDVFYNNRI